MNLQKFKINLNNNNLKYKGLYSILKLNINMRNIQFIFSKIYYII